MRVIKNFEAAQLIEDGWTIVPGGFGSCGHPESLTKALEDRFKSEGRPRNLKLLFASASGDRNGSGVDRLAHAGLISSAIGGFWGLIPKLGKMAMQGAIEGHNWPQGIVSQLYRAIASGKPGVWSSIGIETFVDPEIEGACIGNGPIKTLIKKSNTEGKPILFYPSIPVNCALLRGTSSDPEGNISMSKEVSYSDALAQAMAARNCGGIVVVQVEKLVDKHSISPQDVRIPGILVDYVVVAKPGEHDQTYGAPHNEAYISAGCSSPEPVCMSYAEQIIARRALQEIDSLNARVINLGIGIPALIAQAATDSSFHKSVTFTVESGQIGGYPASGLSFGASYHPAALIEQSALFEFYEGGGLDLSCLGFAEVDGLGNVNVSRFNDQLYGAGGFINISQSTDTILFCGTFTASGLEIAQKGKGICVEKEGKIRKFVQKVSQITFSSKNAKQKKQIVKFITERAVFSLKNEVLYLEEIAPEIALEKDIIPHIEGNFVISADCKYMDKTLFFA
ncbi:hypothetical protein BJP27_05820 [Pseudomonas oryzihabitans]|nr:hypothetical protein BJP27_05820 [Pseudomonas psychrotolerans]